MLNHIKKYIYVYAVLMAFIILSIFMVLDIKYFMEEYFQKYYKNIDNIGVTKNLYAEVLEKVKNSAKKNNKVELKEKNVTKINIYSTNPWRIKIPKLRLNAPITEGTSSESLRRTVGHFEQTNEWNGNVGLAGHNRGYRCNFFQDIKKLKKGDIIIYCTQKGERKYQVVVNTVIKETDWSYLKDTKDNRITLITCEINQREYRRCIQAVEIKNI